MDAWLQAILLYPLFFAGGFILGSFLVFAKCRQGIVQQFLAAKYMLEDDSDD